MTSSQKTSDSKGHDQSVWIQLPLHAPLFVKIAPVLFPNKLTELLEVVLSTGVNGLVVRNTTNAHPALLASPHRGDTGEL
jgi:dihydroorotate dehydrogenase